MGNFKYNNDLQYNVFTLKNIRLLSPVFINIYVPSMYTNTFNLNNDNSINVDKENNWYSLKFRLILIEREMSFPFSP